MSVYSYGGNDYQRLYTLSLEKSSYGDGVHPKIQLKQKKEYLPDTRIYVQAGFEAGAKIAATGGIGAYIRNVNIEGNFFYGLSRSQRIYWVGRTEEIFPFTAFYRPWGGSVRCGYGIHFNKRFMLTPQAGCRLVILSESIEEGSVPQGYTRWPFFSQSVAEKACAASVLLGARFEFAILPWLCCSVMPEFFIPVSRSEGFKALSEVSTDISRYANSFNCSICFNISF